MSLINKKNYSKVDENTKKTFLDRTTNHLKNPRFSTEKNIANELVKKMSPLNIVPSYILIENFNQQDVYQSIVEVTNRYTHSVRLKIIHPEDSGFKVVDTRNPKIGNTPVGTLAPGMSLKLHVIFKAQNGEADVSSRIRIKVESFEEEFEIPCNATNRPPLLKKLGSDFDTQGDPNAQRTFYTGMCWVGERVDQVFRVYNEGGSCWVRLGDLDRHQWENQVNMDEPVFKRSSEEILNFEENHSKLKILQGFNKYNDRRTEEKDADQTGIDKDATQQPRQTMRMQEPQPLEMHPFAILPSEFYLESESFIDLYVIFNPKAGRYFSRSVGFFSGDTQIATYDMVGVGLLVNLGYSMYNSFPMKLKKDEEPLDLKNVYFSNIALNMPHQREFAITNSSPLPVKVKWDFYNKDNPFSSCRRLSISPSELSLAPESEQLFKLNYFPEQWGYENYAAVLQVENIHKLALSNSKVVNDVNDVKLKYNVVGNTSHVTLPFFKIDIECLVLKNELNLWSYVDITETHSMIFQQQSYTITLINPSQAKLAVMIAAFLHEELIVVGCPEYQDSPIVLGPLESRDITVRYVPFVVGEYIITTQFDVDGGEPVFHEFAFTSVGPDVQVVNLNSLVLEVRPNSGKKFPLTLKNNSDSDAEVIIQYKDHNDILFNYHFMNESIPSDVYGYDRYHHLSIKEQISLVSLKDDLRAMSHASSFMRKNHPNNAINDFMSQKSSQRRNSLKSNQPKYFKVEHESILDRNERAKEDKPSRQPQVPESSIDDKKRRVKPKDTHYERPAPKYLNAHSVANSFTRVDLKFKSFFESILDLSERYVIIPPKSTYTIDVTINTIGPVETELIVMTKYSGAKIVPVNLGIDNKVKKKGQVSQAVSRNYTPFASFESKNQTYQDRDPNEIQHQHQSQNQMANTQLKQNIVTAKEPAFDQKYSDKFKNLFGNSNHKFKSMSYKM